MVYAIQSQETIKKQYSTAQAQLTMRVWWKDSLQNEFANFQFSCENKAAEFSIEIIFKEKFQNLRLYNERAKSGQSKTKLSK